MKDVNDIIIRVIDSAGGLFFPIAQRLARDAKLVEYWTPEWEAMPTVRAASIGDGFEEVRRVRYPFSKSNDPDLFVFPDIDFAEMQMDAIDRGYAVWGNRRADELENNRGKFLKMLGEIGLNVPKHEVINGIDKLFDYLRDNDDKFIKVSRFRGDFETMHWRSWDKDKTELYHRSIKLGPLAERMTFYVFDPIEALIEDGIDTFSIDGKWPQTCLHGAEKKNQGYLGTIAQMSDIDHELTDVNDAMGPVLQRYGARGFFSTEVRIATDGKNYFIDPTIRAGIPPSQIQTEMFENYTEFIWAGSNGELIEPVPAAKWGAQVLLHSSGGVHAWSEFEVPEKLEQWVKCGSCVKVGDRICIGPNGSDEGNDVGWLCAIGDSIEDCVKTMLGHIEELPDGISADAYAIAELIKEFHKAEAEEFSMTKETLPDPSIVVD